MRTRAPLLDVRRADRALGPVVSLAGGVFQMGIGVSLFFLAVGAILTWAVEATISGLDVNVVGIILMVIGALGLLLTLMFWGGMTGRRRTEGTVVRERQVDRDVV